jgi:tRNA pseudouridine32 synthase / 23S rRNA pseudouridine746 synthase
MTAVQEFFHPISNLEETTIPEILNNPFYIKPSSLGMRAFSVFHETLLCRDDIQNFFASSPIGKMFGLLVVKTQEGALGFLAAFSGKLGDSTHIAGFVPPVFDTLIYDGFYKQGERMLDALTREIEQLSNATDYQAKLQAVAELKIKHQEELAMLSAQIKAEKVKRKNLRVAASPEVLLALSQESINEQLQLKWFKKQATEAASTAQEEIRVFEDRIQALKNKRKALSQQLQRQLFEQYTFLNAKREKKNIVEIFETFGADVPPAGTGECAAPKLFQFAFQHDLKPVELLEFWWGPSSTSQVRVQGNFYPSCRSKCEPILHHMLSQTPSEAPPLLKDDHRLKDIEIIYQDEHLAVLNKPFDVLSVPGKVQSLSVQDYLTTLFPEAERPMLVHRLDRATSGILLVAMNQAVYVRLQRQFTKRLVKKKYLAILDGVIAQQSGTIDLPLRVDLDNRPQQMVCYEHGLAAKTHFEVLEIKDNRTKIAFYPVTGRTHQLRVHAAHPQGLNTPILGDDLYGKIATRLHLHAAELIFEHPVSRQSMIVTCAETF